MIFYISGTGNTKWAAKTIATSLNERLISIAEAVKGDCEYVLSEDERVGFCFPVHGWRPPFIVRDFIKKLKIVNGSDKSEYVYALCTAGDTVGEAMNIFRQDIRERGLVINSSFSLIMPESYVGLPFMDVDNAENEIRKKENAALELEKYIRIIENRESGINELTIGKWPKINSRIIGEFFKSRLITDKHFHVESSKCIKCGICADVCPVENINGGKGKEPNWLHNNMCMTCFACYHHCPRHAIEFGRRTKNKGQYFFEKNNK